MAKPDSEGQKELKLEPVKEIEIETKDQVVASKIWIYVIIGLLAYLIFFPIALFIAISNAVLVLLFAIFLSFFCRLQACSFLQLLS